jgi:glycosyltransferase involved in cell wall biosynthesis
VLHFQSMSATGMTAYHFLRRRGWPEPARRPGLLTHLWGYGARFPGIRRREIRVLREFDQIHTSSPAVGRLYREHYEVPAEKLRVFVRGINLETFAPRAPEVLAAARAEWKVPADKFVVIHNRHLHRMYRVDIAVEAFVALAKEGHDVFLLLVRGSMWQPDYERELLGRLQAAGLGDRVACLPHVLSASEMATALQLAQCSVNCVPFDAFPVSILEAMYCRAVPVVRNLESYSQFIREGETAFAVEGEVEGFVPRIRQLIVDGGLRERLADAGVALVRAEGSEEIFRRHTLQLIEKCWHGW